MVYAKLYGVIYLKADETFLTGSVRHCISHSLTQPRVHCSLSLQHDTSTQVSPLLYYELHKVAIRGHPPPTARPHTGGEGEGEASAERMSKESSLKTKNTECCVVTYALSVCLYFSSV